MTSTQVGLGWLSLERSHSSSVIPLRWSFFLGITGSWMMIFQDILDSVTLTVVTNRGLAPQTEHYLAASGE